MYVWVDALTNYLTAAGYPETDGETYRRYWPADIHVIGKDIVRFHAVYWPAFLMSAGVPLPKRVFAHGFLNVEGEKMSKSVGNVVDPFDLADTFGVDQIRYFFMREVRFGQDGSYSPEGMISRINSDLANDFGNLAQRVLTMINRNCEARVPTPAALTAADEALLEAAEALLSTIRSAIVDRLDIHTMLTEIWRVIAEANRYVDAQAPWALRKTEPERMATVLYVLAETIRRLAILAQPAVPEAAGRMLDQLAVPDSKENRQFECIWKPEHRLRPGTPLPVPEGVFPRFVAAETETETG
jgi:methionyl-tRNA synthetase